MKNHDSSHKRLDKKQIKVTEPAGLLFKSNTRNQPVLQNLPAPELPAEKMKNYHPATKTKDQGQGLSSKIETIEEERRKISRELHDGVGQMLTAAFLNLEVLESAIENGDDNALSVLHKIRKLLDTTIQETRNISHSLRPSILDDFGLIPGLRMLAEEFSDATGISTIFQHFNFDARLDPKLETTLYRICQEALNNIARHSGATEATIEIFKRSGNILVSINDNGKGIPKNYHKSQNFRAGTGLNNIKERIELHNGKLSINTMNKSGTELLIEFPAGD
ncbi:sensor histidine kinase [Natronogracilivirga saccharolytica]|uniref:Oxygen sensor histidine kinase NreB n=1 Tax=Natronogracilivirga saccharolytica TaxID=2812953 RepID=A0A8J7RKF4_9BACT|nr:sensor histidine kinase [Natronogracilivirga saccharolytica]MBP3193360.1 sensor histidine kinase [Natronogracilivirga saccharolytica]